MKAKKAEDFLTQAVRSCVNFRNECYLNIRKAVNISHHLNKANFAPEAARRSLPSFCRRRSHSIARIMCPAPSSGRGDDTFFAWSVRRRLASRRISATDYSISQCMDPQLRRNGRDTVLIESRKSMGILSILSHVTERSLFHSVYIYTAARHPLHEVVSKITATLHLHLIDRLSSNCHGLVCSFPQYQPFIFIEIKGLRTTREINLNSRAFQYETCTSHSLRGAFRRLRLCPTGGMLDRTS